MKHRMHQNNILFITWDGPQTSYMEGLFMPIFQEIQKQNSQYRFHVIQFTWAHQQKINEVKNAAQKMDIQYTAFPIIKKPIASVGSMLTLFTSSRKIKKYIQENNIDIVMPRSTFPAFMVNKISDQNFKIIFDADGLPIEERMDFSGLRQDSLQYKWMKSIETRILEKADAVITRSQKAVEIHLRHIGEEYREKFSVVFNGRNQEKFHNNEVHRTGAREELSVNDEFLFVYAGSLGPQYCLPEMLQIFEHYEQRYPVKFLILTGNIEFAEKHIPQKLRPKILLKKISVGEVPYYLNAADCAFALRKPSFSMQGVSPIKLGEYLLCGVPVIASKGIGDSEEILQHFEESYLFDHSKNLNAQLSEIINFAEKAIFAKRSEISAKALRYFSLQNAAELYIKSIKKLTND